MFCYHPTFKFIQIHKKLSDAIEEGSDICKLKTEDNVQIRKIYAKCFDRNMTIYEINYIFSIYGDIENIQLKDNKNNNKHKFKQMYCFITFKNPQSATKALINRQRLSEYFEIRPADSWHQPDYNYLNPKLSDLTMEPNSSNCSDFCLMDLNNDCLLKIFSHLDICNLISLKSVCLRFQELVQIQLKSIKSLNFETIKPNNCKLTLLELRNILYHVGPYLSSISVNSVTFNSSNNDRVLQMIPYYCKRLEILKINGFKITKSAKALKYFISKVSDLDLSDNSEMTDDFLNFNKNKKLRNLNLSNNNLLNGKCLLTLQNLTSLNISKCRNINGKHLKEFFVENQLTHLDISECNNLNGNDVNKILSKHCSKLESLHINNFYADTSEIIIPNIGNLHNLLKLQICNVHYPGEDQLLSTLNTENKIEILEIPYGNLTLPIFNAMIQMKNLRVLNLNFKRNLLSSDDDFLLCHVFENNQQLEEIHMADSNFATVCILNAVCLLENLKFLDISRCFGVNNDMIKNVILHQSEKKKEQKLAIKVGNTDVDVNILKEPLYRENKSIIKLIWSTTRCKDEYDYDIDETQTFLGSQPHENVNLDDLINLMSSFDNCSEEIIALIKQNL